MFANNKQIPQAIFWYKSNIEKQTENQINPSLKCTDRHGRSKNM